jgi:hypothetical protein
MKSTTTTQFHKLFARLPEQAQRQAREAYRQFKQNPYHPSLHFKQVHSSQPIYSIRVNLDYRAVGEKEGDEITWFWIGTHSDYDKLISQF